MSTKSKIIYASVIGNILEYYDFTVYSFFAVEIGRVFFSNHDIASQLILSLSVFVIGFIARPFGGILFGSIGDRYGRKPVLLWSLFGMSFATLAIGMLPGYDSIGIYASITLLALRIIQGLCIAGEGPGAAIFALEHFKGYSAGLIGGVVAASNSIGILLGLAVSMILHNVVQPQLLEYVWRIVFITGVIPAFIGLYLRIHVSETKSFLELPLSEKSFFHLKDVLTKNTSNFIRIFFLGGIAGAMTYLIVSYLKIYLLNHLQITTSAAWFCVFIATLTNIILLPVFGYIADIVGNRIVYIVSNIAIAVLIFPIMFIISVKTTPLMLYGALILLGVLTASTSGAAYKYMTELFDPKIRVSAIVFGFNLGIALLGSTVGLITIYTKQHINPNLSESCIIAAYMVVLAGLNLAMFYRKSLR